MGICLMAKKLKQGLCINLEGWDGEGDGREVQKGGKINKLDPFWKRWEYQTTWPTSWEICMQVRKQQLELNMEQQTGSK